MKGIGGCCCDVGSPLDMWGTEKEKEKEMGWPGLLENLQSTGEITVRIVEVTAEEREREWGQRKDERQTDTEIEKTSFRPAPYL